MTDGELLEADRLPDPDDDGPHPLDLWLRHASREPFGEAWIIPIEYHSDPEDRE